MKRNVIWYALCGDALGVPVEFKDRSTLLPVAGYRGFGTHNQPPGTWSDDGQMILATCSALINSRKTKTCAVMRSAEAFVLWRYDGAYTPFGDIFDIGFTTDRAIKQLREVFLQSQMTPGQSAHNLPIAKLLVCGNRDPDAQANGSLMRIAPVVLWYAEHPREARVRAITQIGSITHGSRICNEACVLYGEIMYEALTSDVSAIECVKRAVDTCVNEGALKSPVFSRITGNRPLWNQHLMEVKTSGWVVHALEAAIWAFVKAERQNDAISALLSIINLGDDSDTAGCIAGGLLGTRWKLSSQFRRGLQRYEYVSRLIRKTFVEPEI